jgi:hypothetical protein
VPVWVILIAATAMSLGTAAGGWRIMKTMGQKVVKLDPVHGFAAETTAASIIMVASHFGMPVSTTHVISSAIMGVGSSESMKAVRWGVARSIVTAWVLTIPASAVIAAACLPGTPPGRRSRQSCAGGIPPLIRVRPPQYVADASHGLEVDRIGRVGLDLGPQPVDVDVHGARLSRRSRSPRRARAAGRG